jgi:hypothetical protein
VSVFPFIATTNSALRITHEQYHRSSAPSNGIVAPWISFSTSGWAICSCRLSNGQFTEPESVVQTQSFLGLSNMMVVQLCVWDWLLTLSDELEMIYQGERLRGYLLDMVYLVVR